MMYFAASTNAINVAPIRVFKFQRHLKLSNIQPPPSRNLGIAPPFFRVYCLLTSALRNVGTAVPRLTDKHAADINRYVLALDPFEYAEPLPAR